MAYVDYTGCTVRCQVRPYASSETVLDTIPASVDGDGHIVLSASAEQAQDWAGYAASTVYDVEVTWPSGRVETILAGRFAPKTDVSRSA
ncbi:MAG: hypothetical protein QM714_02640 [Nocardioides sp.]|uniref:hypothetical protein n=1 Tax=Nocardioides sp. TaxID=35761 RepID=UPI0039E55B56